LLNCAHILLNAFVRPAPPTSLPNLASQTGTACHPNDLQILF
jgi:hypothetical protein